MNVRAYLDVLRLVWPLALGMANNAVMQFTDRVFLARFSSEALEAVFPAAMLAFLFIGFFQSVIAYTGTFVAQYHGARSFRGCRNSYRAGLRLSWLSGLLLLLAIPLGEWIVNWSGHAPHLIALEKRYFSITMAGGVFTCAIMAVQSYFTGIGETRLVFWANVFGNITNIALDYLLIFGLGPIPAGGITGAAFATVIAQGLQFGLLYAFAHRRLRQKRAEPETPPDSTSLPFGELIRRILRFGTPAGLYTVLNMLSFTIFVFLTGRIGATDFAASNAVFSVNYLLLAPIEGFAIAAGTLVGQHQGAQDPARAYQQGYRTLLLALVYIFFAAVVVLAFYRPIMDLFIGDTSSLDPHRFHTLGLTLTWLMLAWQLFDCTDVVLSGALKGAGDTRFVLYWMLFCSFGFWMPLLFFVYRFWPTMPALWTTMIIYIALTCTGTLIRWQRGPWRKIRLI